MGVQAWITVRGNHIPIMDGESKTQAIAKFIKDKRDTVLKNRDKDFFKSVKQHQKENKNSKDDYKKSDSYNYWRARQDMEVKYGPNWDKQSKYWIRGVAKPRNDDKDERELDKLNSAIQRAKGYDSNGGASGRPDWQTVRALQDKKQKLMTDINKDNKGKSYKLKEDRIKKTPVSSINVDTYSYRSAHGKEPSSVRVGGSSRGNWAFKLGNETVFINDTYANAKRKAVKEASRRGLTSIKVLS